MKLKPQTTIWVCTDCLFAREGELHSEPDCEPWNLIPADVEVTIGVTEHDDGCTEEARDAEGCSCGTQDFSWQWCQGCGSQLGGSREAYTLWF